MAKMQVVLLGTGGCHLCELALDQWLYWLAKEDPISQAVNWSEQDIADSDELIERYGVRIPVLSLPAIGAELNWPFDQTAIDHFIRSNVAIS